MSARRLELPRQSREPANGPTRYPCAGAPGVFYRGRVREGVPHDPLAPAGVSGSPARSSTWSSRLRRICRDGLGRIRSSDRGPGGRRVLVAISTISRSRSRFRRLPGGIREGLSPRILASGRFGRLRHSGSGAFAAAGPLDFDEHTLVRGPGGPGRTPYRSRVVLSWRQTACADEPSSTGSVPRPETPRRRGSAEGPSAQSPIYRRHAQSPRPCANRGAERGSSALVRSLGLS